jgi:hypothetical protein
MTVSSLNIKITAVVKTTPRLKATAGCIKRFLSNSWPEKIFERVFGWKSKIVQYKERNSPL